MGDVLDQLLGALPSRPPVQPDDLDGLIAGLPSKPAPAATPNQSAYLKQRGLTGSKIDEAREINRENLGGAPSGYSPVYGIREGVSGAGDTPPGPPAPPLPTGLRATPAVRPPALPSPPPDVANYMAQAHPEGPQLRGPRPTPPPPVGYNGPRIQMSGPEAENVINTIKHGVGRIFSPKPTPEAQRLAPFDKTAQPAVHEPMLKLSELAGPDTEPKTIGEGVKRGSLQGLEGWTSPQGAAMMIGMGGLGRLPGAARAVTAALGAGFDEQMIIGAIQQMPEAKAAWDAGRQGEAARLAAQSLVSLGIGTAGARGKIKEMGRQPSLGTPPPEVPAPPIGVSRPQETAAPPELPPQFKPQDPLGQLINELPPKPTAAKPTVPETPDTISLQLQQLADGTRRVVMLPNGTPPQQVPEGMLHYRHPDGNLFIYDPAKVRRDGIFEAINTNRLPELLGPVGGMGAPDKSQLQEPQVAVVGRTPEGTTTQATATDEPHLPQTIEQTQQVTPGGTVSVESPKIELDHRREAALPVAEEIPSIAPPPAKPISHDELVAAGLVPAADQAHLPETVKQTEKVTPEGQVSVEPPQVELERRTAGQEPQQDSAVRRFMGEETGTSTVGAILRADINATKALIDKRAEALKELERAKLTPDEKNAGQHTLEYFTAERDLWGARNNQIIERLRRLVPGHIDQEALSLMRDFKNRPGELEQWRDGTHPNLANLNATDLATALRNINRLRPAIDRALMPTPQMLAVDQTLTSISDATLQEGKRIGFLSSSIGSDEYVTHLLHPPDQPTTTNLSERMGQAIGGKIGRKFSFAQKRNYPTLLDAVADNVKPRTLNALDAFTIHGDKFATSRATHLLIQAVKDSGVGKWGTHAGTAPGGIPQTNFAGTPGIPADWVEIAPHAHPFQNLVSYMDAAGDPATARQTLYVPKMIERALRPITDPDYSRKIVGFSQWRGFQSYAKAVQLSLSLFHAVTENYMAMANMGPKGWIRGLRADRTSPAFLEQERDFIAHGGTSPIQGKTFEAYKSLQPGSIPSWGDIWQRAPVAHQMDVVAGKITEFTFGKLLRQFKVTDYATHRAAWLGEHPRATPEQQIAAMRSISKEINATYGGLHAENLGINRTTAEVARAILLAPDWTFSNLFNVKYALEGKSQAGKMARAFWLRQVVGGVAATQAMSLLLSGKPSARLTQVYYGQDKDGQDIYQNVFFKGASGDVVNLINNVHDYGAVVGLGRSMSAKLAPIPKAMMMIGTNRNRLGETMVPRGMNMVAGTVRGALELGSALAPVPFSITGLGNMLLGPKASQYTLPEYLTLPIAGMPPTHVPPPGTRMTNRGLRPAPSRPEQSVWDQIKTGKTSAPRR